MAAEITLGRFVPIPDAAVVRQIKRIDKDLSVSWVDPPGRFAVFHDLQIDGNYDQSVDQLARELAKTMRAEGYEIPFHECQQRAAEQAKRWKLVCYVVDDDGGYRPLDGRIVEKLQRMDYLRKNVGLMGWRQLLAAKADAVEARRQRDIDDIWTETAKDKAFRHCLDNIMWGGKTRLHIPTGMGEVGS